MCLVCMSFCKPGSPVRQTSIAGWETETGVLLTYFMAIETTIPRAYEAANESHPCSKAICHNIRTSVALKSSWGKVLGQTVLCLSIGENGHKEKNAFLGISQLIH